MRSIVVDIWLSLVACSVHASVTYSPAAPTAPEAATLNATCPSRTVNYITHGLPQQCLPSSWRSTAANLTEANLLTDSATPTFAANASLTPTHGIDNATATSSEPVDRPAEISKDADSPSEPESSSPSPIASSAVPADSDEPSPLEDEKFMSFEEWKRQNLQKAGQSEHIGSDVKPEQHVPRKRPTNIHTALDSLGDDAEIDLDFTGFLPEGPDLTGPEQQASDGDHDVDVVGSNKAASPEIRSRSKDAGTTCKERYNYASFDCAANVLKYNPEATSPLAVLGENKDSYMLNVCSAENKFLMLELCNDISIDTIVLANFEFFSSIFRTFRVSVSDKYPVKIDKWITLGIFEARNTREVQAFLVENPAIWARYVRIEFLTHYGHEYYCPVSLVRVHGTTMMEDYKHDLESLHAGYEADVDGIEAGDAAEETLVPEAVADVLLDEKEREAQEASINTITDSTTQKTNDTVEAVATAEPIRTNTSVAVHEPTDVTRCTDTTMANSSPIDLESSTEAAENICPTRDMSLEESAMQTRSTVPSPVQTRSSTFAETTSDHSLSNTEATQPIGFGYKSATSGSTENTTSLSSPYSPQSSHNATDAPRATANATSSERPKTSSSATQSQAAAPTMQESFFKSVQKRLQMLEANSSLSLQYIEDQSRALRDAFNRVEQRQLAKTTTFLDYLNTTVVSELRDFRQQYDQLWQSTVIELEMQRERYQQETAAINARLGILADEIIFQKRISILQMVLILICLGLVLFTRGDLNQYLEIPVVQRVLSRSPSSRWLNMATLDTPNQSPPPTRDGSLRKRHGILKGHRRMQSEDSIEGSLSPQDMYSPPTPVSVGDASDWEPVKKETRLDGPPIDPSAIARPSTSPPILPSESPSTPDLNGIPAHDTIDSKLTNSPSEKDPDVPRVLVGDATPPAKHLTWSLPG